MIANSCTGARAYCLGMCSTTQGVLGQPCTRAGRSALGARGRCTLWCFLFHDLHRPLRRILDCLSLLSDNSNSKSNSNSSCNSKGGDCGSSNSKPSGNGCSCSNGNASGGNSGTQYLNNNLQQGSIALSATSWSDMWLVVSSMSRWPLMFNRVRPAFRKRGPSIVGPKPNWACNTSHTLQKSAACSLECHWSSIP